MKVFFSSVFLAFCTLHAQGQNKLKFATCDRAWTKIGCFKENKDARALSVKLLDDGNKNSKYHEPGYNLIWFRWEESIHSLACRCAQKALQNNFAVFGLQNYGECWSGPKAESDFNHHGPADGCLMNVDNPTDCVQSSDQECTGGNIHTNYIYKLRKENPAPQTPDGDGD